MWGRKRQTTPKPPKPPNPQEPQALRDALRQARIESAERSAIVVDLRDAEIARLELVNEALDPIFAEVPATIELFDRGISRGESPRLWIDMIAHVAMARDKRVYRFLQDTSYGPKVLAESPAIEEIVAAVTKYVARRMIERERRLAADGREAGPRRRWRALWMLLLGVLVGILAVFAAAWISAVSNQ